MSECVVRMDIDEMPTACGPCELSCTAICKEWTKVDRKEIGRTKSPNCPILAILPEGHGRLIDASYVIDVMQDELDNDVPITVDDCFQIGCKIPTIVPAEAESPSPKPTDPVPIRDVYYVMTECDAKTGTVKYEPRERIEP